jgi:sugar lactone lactonase YvrE
VLTHCNCWPRLLAATFCLAALSGGLALWRPTHTSAAGSTAHIETVWGRAGHRAGELDKPRAIAVDARDQVYLVDKSARIQVFDRDGEFLRGWRTPAWQFGKPTGMSFSRDGLLMVADTHYNRVLFYPRDGDQPLDHLTLGGEDGRAAGRLGWVTDVVQDSQGNYLVSEYGEYDQIHTLTSDGQWLGQWGRHGTEPGEFSRPQALAIDAQDRLYVADACNHRIQIFNTRSSPPQLLQILGAAGEAVGQLRYPYSLLLDGQGHLYILEYGNHRVQKWTVDGQPLAAWGTMGRRPGELFNPWAIALDSTGRLFVLDTYNNRVYRLRM